MSDKHAALLVMNQQIGFMNDSTEQVPDRIRDLLDEVAFNHVYFTQFISRPDEPLRRGMPWDCLAFDDPESGLVPQFVHISQDRVYTTHGLGFPRSVLSRLRASPIETVYLAGVETDGSILKSAFDLVDAGYRPVVLADYCGSCGGAVRHAEAISLLRGQLGELHVHSGRIGSLDI